jgi:hypothetical protein
MKHVYKNSFSGKYYYQRQSYCLKGISLSGRENKEFFVLSSSSRNLIFTRKSAESSPFLRPGTCDRAETFTIHTRDVHRAAAAVGGAAAAGSFYRLSRRGRPFITVPRQRLFIFLTTAAAARRDFLQEFSL